MVISGEPAQSTKSGDIEVEEYPNSDSDGPEISILNSIPFQRKHKCKMKAMKEWAVLPSPTFAAIGSKAGLFQENSTTENENNDGAVKKCKLGSAAATRKYGSLWRVTVIWGAMPFRMCHSWSLRAQ